LNFDGLLKVSRDNQHFITFTHAHSDNILTIFKMSESENMNLGKELELLKGVQKDEMEIYSIMRRYNLNNDAYLNFLGYYEYINSTYTYSTNDLKEVIIRSITEPLQSQRNKVMLPPVLACSTICAIHGASVKQH
jgi:hypothetical protein